MANSETGSPSPDENENVQKNKEEFENYKEKFEHAAKISEILETLESVYKMGSQAYLIIHGPKNESKKRHVFVTDFSDGIVTVRDSKESNDIEINIDDIEDAQILVDPEK